MDSVIELRGVGKRYQQLEEHPMLLRTLIPLRREARKDLWALRDLDLEVKQGETLGVLGQNGAGKTTLLRLLAGVTSPTTGRVRVEGRIGPLIGLGVGFHPEMSGRENVLVNGMLLGLTAKQVQERFDQVVAFAELEEFIDTPVKFYSSGMFMRLGFAVIAHIDPTILLVDEVLAVGDARFQLKCFERLRKLQQDGAAVLMVSHAMHMVRQLCRRGVVLQHGLVEFDGDLEEAIATHEGMLVGGPKRSIGTAVEFLHCGFADSAEHTRLADYDEPIELALRLRFNAEVADPVFTVGAITAAGLFAGFDSTPARRSWRMFQPGEEATVRITFPARLAGGVYRLILDVKDRTGSQRLARSDELVLKTVERTGCTGISDLCAAIELGESLVADRGPA